MYFPSFSLENHRIIETEKEPPDAILSTSFSQAGQSKTCCPYPNGFWTYSRNKTTQPLEATCSTILTVEKCLLKFRSHLLCFPLCPLTLVLEVVSTQKSLHLPFRSLYALTRSPLSLSFSRPNTFSQPLLIGEILQFFYHISGPTLNSFQCDHVSCVLENPELHTALQVWPH